MRIMQKDSEALYRVQTRTEGDRTHLGVINVISRLKLYYQENAGSDLYAGTRLEELL